jgi:hypothetical protein
MKITNLLIHLQNSVDAFSFKPRHLERIRAALPDTCISFACPTLHHFHLAQSNRSGDS